jgi:hypothetical protein
MDLSLSEYCSQPDSHGVCYPVPMPQHHAILGRLSAGPLAPSSRVLPFLATARGVAGQSPGCVAATDLPRQVNGNHGDDVLLCFP